EAGMGSEDPHGRRDRGAGHAALERVRAPGQRPPDLEGSVSAALRDTLREARFFGGLIGALWFACYLYELGFLARFGVPPMLAEIGFSWPLGAVLLAGP